jgi:uroporphyrinogen decarboxylase
MWTDPDSWNALMSKISEVVLRYLNAQIEAGAQAVQLFDSWVGAALPDDYADLRRAARPRHPEAAR